MIIQHATTPHANKDATIPYPTQKHHKDNCRKKLVKPRPSYTNPYTTLPTNPTATNALDNGIHATQQLKSPHNTTQPHKPHHTTVNTPTYVATVRPQYRSIDYKLIITGSINPPTLTTSSPPLAPKILRSKHAAETTRMPNSPLLQTPLYSNTPIKVRSESRQYRSKHTHSTSLACIHCTPHLFIQTQRSSQTLWGEHAQPANTTTHSIQHSNQPHGTHSTHMGLTTLLC